MEIARGICPVQVVTYKKRSPALPFLDDILQKEDQAEAIYVVHWSPHVQELLRILADRDTVYMAHSVGSLYHIPSTTPVLCVSKYIQSYWGKHSANGMIFHLPNQIANCFTNLHSHRTIDVLVHARKSSAYLLEHLVPALRPSCRVTVLNSWVDNLPDIFNASKVYLYDSSDYCGSGGEGFGLQPLEAMACGCTVFSNIDGGLSDFLDPGFNSYKLRVYSKQYDVERILHAVCAWKDVSADNVHLDFYREEKIKERFAGILVSINEFFDSRKAYTADIPVPRQQSLDLLRARAKGVVPSWAKKCIRRLLP
jgi:glycosyltransferase involved in cell wall biosynthesis